MKRSSCRVNNVIRGSNIYLPILCVMNSPIKKKLHSLYSKVAVFRQHLQTIESASFTNAIANVARATNQILPQATISVDEMTALMDKLAETKEAVQEAREAMEVEEEEEMDDEKLEKLLDEITAHPPSQPLTNTSYRVNEHPVIPPSDEMEPVMVTE